MLFLRSDIYLNQEALKLQTNLSGRQILEFPHIDSKSVICVFAEDFPLRKVLQSEEEFNWRLTKNETNTQKVKDLVLQIEDLKVTASNKNDEELMKVYEDLCNFNGQLTEFLRPPCEVLVVSFEFFRCLLAKLFCNKPN